MRKVWLSLGCVALLAILGWAQAYGPGEIYYGGIRLQISGKVIVSGTCSPAVQLAPGVSQIQCQVPEGVAGTVELTATRTPAGAVNVCAERVPSGWPSTLWTQQLGQWVDSRSSVTAGWGTVTAQYRFTPPAGSAGRQVTLRFKAWTAGVVGELELKVILDIVRGVTPIPPPAEPTPSPTYGPFTGTTDGTGRFEVPIPTLPDTAVTGQLTECTVKPLPNRQVSVILVPKAGLTTVSWADQVGAVRVSSPGYGEVEITELRLLSSMDVYGRTSTTVDVGTVCLRPTAPTQPVTPTALINGKSDADGRFTVSLPWPGTTVSGRLTECTVKPLPNQEFTLTIVPKGEMVATAEDIAGFAFRVPGYRETTVTQFSKLSLFGLTWYDTGPVCLFSIGCPEIPLRVLTQNTKHITHDDPTVPARKQEIFKLLRGQIDYNFDIVCLQEWFQDAGPAGAIGLEAWSTQKGSLLRHWLGPGAQPDLTERDVEDTDAGGIRIVDARPNSWACEIIVGPNYVAGPDAAWFLESRIDSGLVILTRPGLTIVQASAFVYSASTGWDWYASKGALYARVQLDPDNPSCYLHVFNTHLQAGEGKEEQRIRQAQLEELRRFIENCTSDDRLQGRVQHPVILCGDLNVIGGSKEWENHLQNLVLVGQNFKDAWLTSGKKDQPAKDSATWVGNDQNTLGTPWGPRNVLAAENGDFQRLDYIFYFSGESPLGLVLKFVDREPANPPDPTQKPYPWGGYTVSDHLGVVALFLVQPK